MKNDRRWLHIAALTAFATFGVGAKDAGLGCCKGENQYPYLADAATDAATDAAPDAAADAAADSAVVVDDGAADASVD